ncbi:MAG: hypothetical protein AAFZ87_10330 [Planctomycetota bacterium]
METKEIIKYVGMLCILPYVLPFAKMLVRDLLEAFEEDGGLMGEKPTGERLEKIREAKAQRPSPMVSEPLAHVKAAASEQSRRG